MIRTTVGKLIANETIPEEYRDYSAVFDRKFLGAVFEDMAKKKDTQKYKDTVSKTFKVGGDLAYIQGSSFAIRDLRTDPKVKEQLAAIRARIRELNANKKLTAEQRAKAIQDAVFSRMDSMERTMYDEAIKKNNPFAEQVASGSRGKLGDMRSLMLGDLVMSDHKKRLIPIPILNSYSHGVDPAEFWAGAYGTRMGLLSTKQSTAETGFYGKQLKQAAHKLVVTTNDCKTKRGILAPADDKDNVGAVIARDYDGVAAGTVFQPEHMSKLTGEILVRSPLTCDARSGVCAKCVGVREFDDFPKIGDNVGMIAAQAISEPTTQLALSAKHSGGKASKTMALGRVHGFDLVNQLVQSPKMFADAALIAKIDGPVNAITDAPQGGKFVTIGNQRHHVAEGFEVLVKPGQMIEAGDILSDGIPNPAELVKYKGLGEGRRRFVDVFKKAYTDNGGTAHRRNVELLARGLVNHVKVNEIDAGGLPGDIVEYSELEKEYRPRYGAVTVTPTRAVGKYLERPALHYSIGTRVTKSVADKLKDEKELVVHDDEPSFQPHFLRAMETLSKDPDWQVRLGGFYLQRGLLSAAQTGAVSKQHSESFIPSLIRGDSFGKELDTTGKY